MVGEEFGTPTNADAIMQELQSLKKQMKFINVEIGVIKRKLRQNAHSFDCAQKDQISSLNDKMEGFYQGMEERDGRLMAAFQKLQEGQQILDKNMIRRVAMNGNRDKKIEDLEIADDSQDNEISKLAKEVSRLSVLAVLNGALLVIFTGVVIALITKIIGLM